MLDFLEAIVASRATATAFVASLIAFPGLQVAHAQEACELHRELPPAYADLVRQNPHGQPAPTEIPRGFLDPTAGSHGQIFIGGDLLYHLPLFMTDAGRHPHNFQVILRISLPDAVAEQLAADRAENPEALYTAIPPIFAQRQLAAFPGHPPLDAFDSVQIVRHHFERPDPQPVPLAAAPITIESIVHLRQLAPGAAKPEGLTYLVVESGDEVVLAKLLDANPDFDHLLLASVKGGPFEGPVFVTLPERKNAATDRLAPGESLTCDAGEASLHVVVEAEVYCEAGELGNILGQGSTSPRDCPPLSQ